MQLLTFAIGGHPYAIPSRRIVEVLPLVAARPLPHAPHFVRGLFSYRGRLLPLVDLGVLLGAGAAPELLSTRVIVVSLDQDAEAGIPVRQHGRQLGLVAEHVISIRSADHTDTVLSHLELASAPYLGPVYRLGGDTIQVLDIDRLLPDDLVHGLMPGEGLMPATTPERRR
jgi:chemotaxis-related protein WspB